MFHRLQTKKAPAGQESVFVVSDRCFAPTIDVLRGRAEPLRIRLVIGDVRAMPQDVIDTRVRRAGPVSGRRTVRSRISGR